MNKNIIQFVNILTSSGGKSLLFRNYGDSEVDQDLLAGFLSAFSGFIKEISDSDIKSTLTEEYKYYYTIVDDLLIVICTDLEDEDKEINSKLNNIRAKFIEEYGNYLKEGGWDGNRAKFKSFERELDNIILGAIKCSIIGLGGVGKTTLLHLICGKEIDLEYVPTVTADITSYDGDGLETNRNVILWDFAGQKQYQSLWNNLLEGTDIALLVTDSTYENLNATKDIIDEILDKYYKDTFIIGIANKQDLSNRLTPEFCEKLLSSGKRKIPTHGMIAINKNYREKIFAILNDAIDEIEQKKFDDENL